MVLCSISMGKGMASLYTCSAVGKCLRPGSAWKEWENKQTTHFLLEERKEEEHGAAGVNMLQNVAAAGAGIAEEGTAAPSSFLFLHHAIADAGLRTAALRLGGVEVVWALKALYVLPSCATLLSALYTSACP